MFRRCRLTSLSHAKMAVSRVFRHMTIYGIRRGRLTSLSHSKYGNAGCRVIGIGCMSKNSNGGQDYHIRNGMQLGRWRTAYNSKNWQGLNLQ